MQLKDPNKALTIHQAYEETALISSFQQGERKALHEIYALYLRPLCFFAEQLVSNTMAAEDIASDCFIQAFHKRTDFPTLGQLRAFLYTSAKNAALNYLKAQKRHDDVHYSIEQSADRLTIDAEAAYIKAEAMQAIFGEIEKLPPQCRQVVRLSIIDGKRPQEIAEELNMAYQTVLNQKAKGVGLLRTALLKNQLLSLSILASGLLLLRQ